MSDFRNYLNEQLQRPSFKAEWDALQPELTIAQAMIDARKESGLTQKQLSERTGIAQADISKLERGNANPSLRTLQRLAAGMGMNVKIVTFGTRGSYACWLRARSTPRRMLSLTALTPHPSGCALRWTSIRA